MFWTGLKTTHESDSNTHSSVQSEFYIKWSSEPCLGFSKLKILLRSWPKNKASERRYRFGYGVMMIMSNEENEWGYQIQILSYIQSFLQRDK